MEGRPRRAGVVGVLVLAFAPAGAFAPVDAAPQEIREVRVDVGGASVRARCTRGRPEVVLLHGERSGADTWRPVLERLAGTIGACAYDRVGSGRSGPPPPPRGWYELLDELRRIHLALGFEGGFVLVGHSLGGLYARVYAADRPDDVAGLLLVDPGHERLPERIRDGMPEEDWRAWVRERNRPNEDGVVERAVGERAARAYLPRIPVTVVTATVRRDGDGWSQRLLNEAAQQVHASIVRSVEFGRHVPAPGSGHDVQRDDPQLVVDEIMRLVRMMRAR